MRLGVRLAVDYGQARIGVARCDAAGSWCSPVETIRNDAGALARLAELVAEYAPIEVVWGFPLRLDGGEGPAAAARRAKAAEFAAAVPDVPVRLVDERMSTAAATTLVREAGRTARSGRAIIDQAAAVAILEQALAIERSTGNPPGIPLREGS
ncbi:MAG: Holliday junction resolvase RuvX [Propionibacteriaceae bacterium]|jgi:putative Holliday junction resolvase|nr:Holliday junction resolvase RuvX [Propionibacteriaceae bacterium]